MAKKQEHDPKILCDLWLSLSKEGVSAQEIPARYNDETGLFISQDEFYRLTRDSDEYRAQFDTGQSNLKRYMRELIEESIDKDTKLSTAQANLIKAYAKEAAGYEEKSSEPALDLNGQPYQLAITNTDGEVLGFMTKIGVIMPVGGEKKEEPKEIAEVSEKIHNPLVNKVL